MKRLKKNGMSSLFKFFDQRMDNERIHTADIHDTKPKEDLIMPA